MVAYGIVILFMIKRHTLTSHIPSTLTILGHWVRSITWSNILIRENTTAQISDITPRQLKAYCS